MTMDSKQSDRELLELAAKVAGVHIDKSPYNGGGAGNTGFDMFGNAVIDWHNGKLWNPLTDDGDALRLAVKLRINIYNPPNGKTSASVCHGGDGSEICSYFNERSPDTAATRRAIVRAAAAIGMEA